MIKVKCTKHLTDVKTNIHINQTKNDQYIIDNR